MYNRTRYEMYNKYNEVWYYEFGEIVHPLGLSGRAANEPSRS